MAAKDFLKPTAIALGCAGAAVAAPFLAPYLATVALPFFGTVLARVFKADDFTDGVGKVIVNTAAGILTNLGSSAAEKIPSTLKGEHNFHLEQLLATAYLESIVEIEGESGKSADTKVKGQTKAVLPSIKARIARGLKERKPFALFPVDTAERPVTTAFSNRFSAETTSFMVADEAKWREQLGDEVEIALRRWLNEAETAARSADGVTALRISRDTPLPEPLRTLLRDQLPQRIARRISELVKQPAFKESWIAFQRAHLQGTVRVLNRIDASQGDIKDELATLATRIEHLTDTEGFVEALAEKLEAFLKEVSLTKGDMEVLLNRQSEDLLQAFDTRLDQHTDRLSGEIKDLGQKMEQQFQAGVRHATQLPPFELPKRAFAREFFGRAGLLIELEKRLNAREHVDVWGPAGMGKTALAAEAIHRVVGGTRDGLALGPYLDGIVLLDLYQLKTFESAWIHLADAFDTSVPTTLGPAERARVACRGRDALVIVEGAEEAGDGEQLQKLLAVLGSETTRLVLTRDKRQVSTAQPFRVEEQLGRDEGLALLRSLSLTATPEALIASVYDRLGGHPLALTWAGSQLASREESPQVFLAGLEAADLPGIHEPGYESHTLAWLYGRSVSRLTVDAQRVLSAAGLLAHLAFPLSAALAALASDANEGADIEMASRAALKQLVRHGLLRVDDTSGDLWEFTHVTAYQFARATAETDCLLALGAWCSEEFGKGTASVRANGNFERLGNALSHATALLKAERNAEQLATLANSLLYDGLDEIRIFGRLDFATIATGAVRDWLETAPASHGDDVKWQRDVSFGHDQIGDALAALGDGPGALAAFRKGFVLREGLVLRDPANTEWQHDLSVSHNKIGDVLSQQGDSPGALTAYRKGLAIREALGANDPANTEWQRELSVNHDNIGDILMAMGDDPGALVAYRKGFVTAKTLASRDPGNALWQHDLSISIARIGDVLSQQGEGRGALAAYRTGLSIGEALAASDATNTVWQHDLSVSHDNIGDILMAMGDGPGALAAYRKGVTIREALVASDPADTLWQSDLSVSHDKIGDALIAAGDGPGALTAHRKGLAIREVLAARNPSNTQWQRALVVSHNRIGDVLVAQGDGAGALTAYRKSLSTAEALAASDPANTQWQDDLSVSHDKIGDVLIAACDDPGALAAYRKGLTIREALTTREPANTEWQRDLSVSHNRIGDVLVARADGPGALAAYRKGLTIHEALAARDPSDTQSQCDVAFSCIKLGTLEHGQSLDTRRSCLVRGREILIKLKKESRLPPDQDWIAWFDKKIATL